MGRVRPSPCKRIRVEMARSHDRPDGCARIRRTTRRTDSAYRMTSLSANRLINRTRIRPLPLTTTPLSCLFSSREAKITRNSAKDSFFFFFSTSRNFPFLLCAKSLTTNMYDWKIVSKKILSNLDRQVPSSLLFPTFVLTVYVRVKTYVRIVHRSRLCQVDSVCKTCENSERRSDIYRYAQCVTRAFKRILSLLYDVAFTYPAVVARFWLEHYPSISFSLSFSLSPSFSIYLRSCGTKGRAQQFEMNCPQLNNKPIRACIQRAYMYVRNTLETE